MGNIVACLKMLMNRQRSDDDKRKQEIPDGSYLRYDDVAHFSIYDQEFVNKSDKQQVKQEATATPSFRNVLCRLFAAKTNEVTSKSNLLHPKDEHDLSTFNPKDIFHSPGPKIYGSSDVKQPSSFGLPRRYDDSITSVKASPKLCYGDVMHIPLVTFGDFLTTIFDDHSDKMAMIEDKTNLTFYEMDLLIKSLCRSLVKRRVGHHDAVCYISNNAIYLVMFLCAVTYLGAKLIPLDPKQLLDLLPIVLRENHVKIIVCDISVCKNVQRTAWKAKLYRTVYTIGTGQGCRSVVELITLDNKQHHHGIHQDSHIDPKVDPALTAYRKVLQSNDSIVCASTSYTHYSLIVNLQQLSTIAPDHSPATTLICNPANTDWRRLIGSLLTSLVRGHTVMVTHGKTVEELARMIHQVQPNVIHVWSNLLGDIASCDIMKTFDWSMVSTIFCAVKPDLIPTLKKLNIASKVIQLFGHPVSLFTHYSTSLNSHHDLCTWYPLPRTRCKIMDPTTNHHALAEVNGEVWVKGPQISLDDAHTIKHGQYDSYGWLNTGHFGHVDGYGHLCLADDY